MTELIVALTYDCHTERLRKHSIQIDPDTCKHSMAMCLKGKRSRETWRSKGHT